jgi:hypothetical protein
MRTPRGTATVTAWKTASSLADVSKEPHHNPRHEFRPLKLQVCKGARIGRYTCGVCGGRFRQTIATLRNIHHLLKFSSVA